MTYLQDKKQNLNKKIFKWAVIFIFAYILLFTRVFNVLTGGMNFIAVPVWKTQNTISSMYNDVKTIFMSKKNLEDENRNLNEDLRIAGTKLLDRNLLYEENAKLKGLLGRDIKKSTSVFAVVLTKPNRSLYDTVIIDVGKNKGIKKNEKVLYGGNIVIGKIAQVFEDSSKVLLYSSPGEKNKVTVGDNNISTIAYGRGGGNFELKLPRDTSISIGDAISVPGIKTQVLGVVGYIESKPSNPFKTIIFKGPIDIFKLKWVEVETNSL